MPDLMVAFLGWNSNFEKKVRGAYYYYYYIFLEVKRQLADNRELFEAIWELGPLEMTPEDPKLLRKLFEEEYKEKGDQWLTVPSTAYAECRFM